MPHALCHALYGNPSGVDASEQSKKGLFSGENVVWVLTQGLS
jgi:hypothetical protein